MKRAVCVAAGCIGAAVFGLAFLGASATGFPPYLDAWEAKYPGSTLPQRMESQFGSRCFVCHHPPSLSDPGTCYRSDLTALFNDGLSLPDALDALDGMDSVGDGFSNGEKILFPRADMPGQVGYHPGLTGPLGTDPCGSDPNAPVTGVRETPCPPDWNGDGVVDSDDLFDFLSDWAAGDADYNGDGVTDSDDLFDFLSDWSAGC